MALVVEDGTGKTDAEAYGSLAEFKAHVLAFHGDVLRDKGDDECERALRRATLFLDIQFEYGGSRSTAAQALEFPRTGLSDDGGYAVSGVPTRLKKATFELAKRAIAEDLMPDIERANRVKSESVAGISVTYADDAPESKLYRVAEKLVRPFVEAAPAAAAVSPGFTPVAGVTSSNGDPYFTLGMHDYPKG
ncbi:MAG: hypothetical protein KA761_00170 [Gemmatimonadaceae bacterium]|nr:hypothetical protein [Gemmatimonadaceae bacterium]